MTRRGLSSRLVEKGNSYPNMADEPVLSFRVK